MADGFDRLYAELVPPDGSGSAPVVEGLVTRCGGGQPLEVAAAGLVLECGDLAITSTLDWTWLEDSGGDALLRVGDRVVLLTADGQDFYLIAKVVGGDG